MSNYMKLICVSLLAVAPAMAQNGPPTPSVRINGPVDVNVVSEPDTSIASSAFAAWPASCISTTNNPCLTKREITGGGFLLHYVHLTLDGRQSAVNGCGGDVRINVLREDGSRFIWFLFNAQTDPGSSVDQTLTLPVPIRLAPGDEIASGATNAFEGKSCFARAIFGGEQL